jgi:hypothetical protein
MLTTDNMQCANISSIITIPLAQNLSYMNYTSHNIIQLNYTSHNIIQLNDTAHNIIQLNWQTVCGSEGAFCVWRIG